MLWHIKSILACMVLFNSLALAATFDGDFTSQTPDGDVHLSIQENESQLLSGELFDGVSRFRLIGRRNGDTAIGRISTDVPPGLGFTVTVGNSAEQIVLQIYPLDASGNPALDMVEELVFSRAGATVADDTVLTGDSPAMSRVFINRQALSQEQVAGFERQYQTRLIDGRYWYDARCGAWGLEGGPTVGFILPSLSLPQPMPADISAGGTGIFINGRELHPVDRQALIGMFGTAIPGRYWLDAYGNLGVEGGGVIANLAAAAQQAGQQNNTDRLGDRVHGVFRCDVQRHQPQHRQTHFLVFGNVG